MSPPNTYAILCNGMYLVDTLVYGERYLPHHYYTETDKVSLPAEFSVADWEPTSWFSVAKSCINLQC